MNIKQLLPLLMVCLISCLGSCKKDEELIPPPVIKGFTPTSGFPGAHVNIFGSNFSTNPEKNEVRFGQIKADVVTASKDALLVVVPTNAGSGEITVKVGENETASKNNFIVTGAPTITSFAPVAGAVGISVTINGTNFSTTSENVVRFNDIQATVNTFTATQLTVTVPANATTGKISVTIQGVTTLSGTDFTVTAPAPVITSFAPASAAAGSHVTITGTNFNPTVAGNVVKFDEVSATITSASATELVVKVPSGSTTGKLSVTTGGNTVLSATDFTGHPEITSFTPSSGKAGSQVTIEGYNFSGSNIVTIAGAESTHVVTVGTTHIAAIVPNTVGTGSISVKVGSATGSSATHFTVTDTWQVVSTLPAPARSITRVSFSILDKGYSGASGQLSLGGNYKDFWEFNSVTKVWTQKATFPGAARNGAIGFAVGGRGYVTTGFASGVAFKDCWEYDPVANLWFQKADFPGAARSGAAAFVIGSKAYVGMGTDNGNPLYDLWEFNPSTNQWVAKHDLTGATTKEYGTSFAIGNKGYVGGGGAGNDFWEYDPITGWTRKKDIPSRDARGSFVIGSKAYVSMYVGGVGQLWQYDPDQNNWNRKALSQVSGYYEEGFELLGRGYMQQLGLNGVTMMYTPEFGN